MPNHGIFIENRLRKIIATGDISARVVAPVPWFPLHHPAFGRFAKFARVPVREERHGIIIDHPRFLVIPSVGARLTPHFLFRSMLRSAKALINAGEDFDVVDGHYFFPDGVAAAWLAKAIDKPLVMSARGSDLNIWADNAYARPLIQQSIEQCEAIITVSAALKQRVLQLGGGSKRIEILRNGVDLAAFYPVDRESTRTALGMTGFVALSVGNLIELKGHHLAIEALSELPQVTLVICGEGPMLNELRSLAEKNGVSSRVKFAGRIPHSELNRYYGAADVLLLLSSNEGWPNVLLEAMACGTSVVATSVGGIPEVVQSDAAGFLIAERTVAAVRNGLQRAMTTAVSREATRAYAEGFGWDDTAKSQARLYKDVAEAKRVASAA
jgi:teichuronic acid biosynthesis glycosyltransferase TuaC